MLEGGTFDVLGERVVRVRWPLRDGGCLVLLASFASETVHEIPMQQGETLYVNDSPLAASLARGELPAHGVVLTLEARS